MRRASRAIEHDCVNEQSITPTHLNRVLKDLARRCRFRKEQVAAISGHSFRMGAAQNMAAAGVELPLIMHSGGWESPKTLMRYLENLNTKRSGTARFNAIRASELQISRTKLWSIKPSEH